MPFMTPGERVMWLLNELWSVYAIMRESTGPWMMNVYFR